MNLILEKGKELVYLGKQDIEGSKGTFSICEFAEPDTYMKVSFFVDKECKIEAQKGDKVKIIIKVTEGKRTYFSLIQISKV